MAFGLGALVGGGIVAMFIFTVLMFTGWLSRMENDVVYTVEVREYIGRDDFMDIVIVWVGSTLESAREYCLNNHLPGDEWYMISREHVDQFTVNPFVEVRDGVGELMDEQPKPPGPILS